MIQNIQAHLWSTVEGDVAQEVELSSGRLPVRSHPGCVEVSLSETPNPQMLQMIWLVPCMAASWCVDGWIVQRFG